MKKRIIIGAVFAIVFIAALLTFSFVLNRGADNATADIGAAKLPTLSFEESGYQINELPGYTESMEITTMRDMLLPLSVGTSVKANINGYSGRIHSAAYEVYTLDGETCLKEKKLKEVKDTVNIELDDTISDGGEKVLKIRLDLDGKKKVYYYTRVVRAAEFNVQQCLAFAEDFHNKTLEKDAVKELEQYLLLPEKNAPQGSLQTVTLYSDIVQLGWGSLTPVVVGEPCWQIKESNETYTSILLKYQVKAKERLYNVNEFLKVRFLKGEASIEDYERTMNEVFNGASEHFDKKGIALGMRGGQVQYLVNDTGDVITFVQEREVWNYNKKKDEISLVFSFADAENDDIRNYNDNHSIRLIHVDKAGNLTFAVYGYMNRGSHEGKVGTAVYYFDSAENHVEEKAFINSRKSGAVTALKEEQLICYNNAQDMLFILADGALHKVDLEARETEILVENLTAEQYAASEDGTYLAYQSNGGLTEANVMTVWDLRAGKSFEIRAAADEFVRPLGFLESDVIYGTGRKKDAGKMTSGEKVQPMYKLEISNGKNEVVKTSQTEKVYVTGIRIENNMVTLNRVKKSGKAYVSIFEDYITSNREQKPCPVSAETYFKEEEGTLEVFLTDENQIENTSPRLMKAKQRLSDKTVTIGIAQTVENRGYYVYGHGKLQGIYEKAGEAIAEADKVRGVVVTSRQTKVWERGNRLLRYNKEGAGAFAVKPGENSLEACVRKILELEGKNIDAAAEMAEGKSAMQLLDEYSGGEAVDLTGCTAEELFYLIGRGTPVIAMTGSSSAILLVGYDDTMITYLNPATGRKPIEYISTVERMVQETQGTFIGYVK